MGEAVRKGRINMYGLHLSVILTPVSLVAAFAATSLHCYSLSLVKCDFFPQRNSHFTLDEENEN